MCAEFALLKHPVQMLFFYLANLGKKMPADPSDLLSSNMTVQLSSWPNPGKWCNGRLSTIINSKWRSIKVQRDGWRRNESIKWKSLVFDLFSGHLTDRVKCWLEEENTDLLVIPSNLTSTVWPKMSAHITVKKETLQVLLCTSFFQFSADTLGLAHHWCLHMWDCCWYGCMVLSCPSAHFVGWSWLVLHVLFVTVL